MLQVLKKFGVEIFDPTNEPFDPHMHNAVFQVPDGSKPPGTVAAVLKVCLIVIIGFFVHGSTFHHIIFQVLRVHF